LAVGERFDGLERKVDDGVKALVDILDLMRADLRDVKIALGPFVRTVASLEDSVRDLDRRVVRLEERPRARGSDWRLKMRRDGMRRRVHGEYKENPCLGGSLSVD